MPFKLSYLWFRLAQPRIDQQEQSLTPSSRASVSRMLLLAHFCLIAVTRRQFANPSVLPVSKTVDVEDQAVIALS